MDAGTSSARQARAKHRHELRNLTYVTIDQANGGIVRNLTHVGIGVQAVAAPPPRQQVRVRFELRDPRLRVETHGEVTWSTLSGRCGIRFLDLPPRMTRQINEWILGDLLEGAAVHGSRAGTMFSVPVVAEEDDGLMVSAAPLKVIELPMRPAPFQPSYRRYEAAPVPPAQLDWLSQPLSGRGMVWTINTLVAVAALLLFALVFLAVTREPPPRPLAMVGVGTVAVAVLYWGFFQIFGGSSPGTRLARLVGCDLEDEDEARDARFR
jgi:hypothetical protein